MMAILVAYVRSAVDRHVPETGKSVGAAPKE